MTPRQRFVTLMQGGTPDALPLLADLSYWHSAQRGQGKLDARYEGDDGYIRLHEDLGVVFYYDYEHDGVWDVSLEGAGTEQIVDGLDTVHVIRTRSGVLRGRQRYIPSSFCSAHVEYMVKDPSDLKLVREYVESYRYVPQFERFVNQRKRLGEVGVPCAVLPRSPLSVLMVDLAGVETTAFLSVDAPDEFEKTLDCIDRTSNAAFEMACYSPATIFHFADNLSSENVGHLFGRFLAPYYTRRIDQLHKAGKKAASHLDGTIKGLLGPLAATGIDAVESLTTKPVGDVHLADLRAEAKSESVILWGGLPGALFSSCYSRKEIESQVDDILRIFGRNGRFIPGTADQVPPDADIELVKLAADRLATG
jgi:uroporphyrinogen-III decarboxylase